MRYWFDSCGLVTDNGLGEIRRRRFGFPSWPQQFQPSAVSAMPVAAPMPAAVSVAPVAPGQSAYIVPEPVDACQLWGGTLEKDEFDEQCYCIVGGQAKVTNPERCAGMRPGERKRV